MNKQSKSEKLKNIYLLFIKFFKIGLFTFGGGYSMISLIHTEVVENMKWLDDDEMLKMIVIAESTPGVLAINTATFTGYKIAGVVGSAVATLGAVLPSLIVICIISLFFDEFKQLKYVAYAFNGIRAGTVLLIAKAVVKLDKKNKKSLFYFVILGLTIIASLFFKINTVYILLAALIFGIAHTYIFLRGNKND
ncbi:MAG: chromate transporter [Oscillospiraceae bacterium]|nr:chromate transporter [Oscillospiraceae bacterium]